MICFTTTYLRGTFTAQKSSFPLRIFSVNVTKSAGNCGTAKISLFTSICLRVHEKVFFEIYDHNNHNIIIRTLLSRRRNDSWSYGKKNYFQGPSAFTLSPWSDKVF